MKKIILFIFASICLSGAAAQDNCYFPTTTGTSLSYKYYDHRGKASKDDWRNERWMRFTVEGVWPQDDGIVINVAVANETIERLAKSKSTELIAEGLSYGDVKIQGDSVVWDNMQWIARVEPEMLAYMAGRVDDGLRYRVELAAITSFPRGMSVGDTLPDERILDARYFEALTPEQIAEREKQMQEFRTEALAMGYNIPPSRPNPSIEVKARVRSREVEAIERVETPAGTFDCYKITYELVEANKLGIAFFASLAYSDMSDEEALRRAQKDESIKYADWISPEVGLVKREKYNDKGKIQEIMILETITK